MTLTPVVPAEAVFFPLLFQVVSDDSDSFADSFLFHTRRLVSGITERR